MIDPNQPSSTLQLLLSGVGDYDGSATAIPTDFVNISTRNLEEILPVVINPTKVNQIVCQHALGQSATNENQIGPVPIDTNASTGAMNRIDVYLRVDSYGNPVTVSLLGSSNNFNHYCDSKPMTTKPEKIVYAPKYRVFTTLNPPPVTAVTGDAVGASAMLYDSAPPIISAMRWTGPRCSRRQEVELIRQLRSAVRGYAGGQKEDATETDHITLWTRIADG